ncbi:MAG: hypothetical protein AAF770_03490 [Bacteroidota bacterium]
MRQYTIFLLWENNTFKRNSSLDRTVKIYDKERGLWYFIHEEISIFNQCITQGKILTTNHLHMHSEAIYCSMSVESVVPLTEVRPEIPNREKMRNISLSDSGV